ncbi:uncharacterized protein LOC128557576 [Mercenaria mercenaria]|uniref:uncharacterized protein LOC128557576 n=1 Tax=Mercenaria mercenaria TaxID=6596 RepID=UPI00234EF513|nr:uncharacterized protein LOC128557576 [Mercenaria mercenaria]XP_053401045.1 uncharacterized protein LOC128557576 [Mercenaria mercenaria]XP_053401046.1 uncharacterized protein LOC128557576 [Mercenaria mercenaria]XP_053401047.1 uncharacterized protein LOC128557576 [Mercenaria mercenaria]
MSTGEERFQCKNFIISFERYPRVHYFKARIKDFSKRLITVIGRLPRNVRDESVLQLAEDLNKTLDKKLNVILIGEEDVTLEDLCISTQCIDDMETGSTSSCVTVIICQAVIEALDEKSVKIMVLVAQQISKTVRSIDMIDSVLIFCKAKRTFTDEERTTFRDDVNREIESSTGLFVDASNIIISTEIGDLKSKISFIYETRIIEVFVKIRLFLSLFVMKNRRGAQKQHDALEYKPMLKAILNFLRNGFSICDIMYMQNTSSKKSFLSQIVGRLARHVRCTIIAPVASKHMLPNWLCAELLNEIALEDVLIKSISNKSRYFLRKLERIYISAKTITRNITNGEHVSDSAIWNVSHCFSFDFIQYPLQRDFEEAASKTESTMSSVRRLLNIMGKMIYEIDGYLKQSIVQYVPIPNKELTINIPDRLRRDILAMDGVYGIGTIYGEIEIHLLKDTENKDAIPNLAARLKSLMLEYHLQNAYKIKQIKQ